MEQGSSYRTETRIPKDICGLWGIWDRLSHWNWMSGIINKLRSVLDTRMSFIILLGGIMRLSESRSIHPLPRCHIRTTRHWRFPTCRLLTVFITPLRNFDFESVNKTAAEAIAGISAACEVPRFVQVSHICADHNSPSKFYRTKAEGEDAVRAVFPEAIVVRPSTMYGIEDRFLNSLACTSYPFLPKHISCLADESSFLSFSPFPQTGQRSGNLTKAKQPQTPSMSKTLHKPSRTSQTSLNWTVQLLPFPGQ
jgi:hypothetical protein